MLKICFWTEVSLSELPWEKKRRKMLFSAAGHIHINTHTHKNTMTIGRDIVRQMCL